MSRRPKVNAKARAYRKQQRIKALEVDFAPLHGFIHRGPYYSEERRGWWVYANESKENNVPVTLLSGHRAGLHAGGDR